MLFEIYFYWRLDDFSNFEYIRLILFDMNHFT